MRKPRFDSVSPPLSEHTQRAHNVEIPFVEVDGKQCLTEHQLQSEKFIADFVKRFPACFQYDIRRRVYWFKREGW